MNEPHRDSNPQWYPHSRSDRSGRPNEFRREPPCGLVQTGLSDFGKFALLIRLEFLQMLTLLLLILDEQLELQAFFLLHCRGLGQCKNVLREPVNGATIVVLFLQVAESTILRAATMLPRALLPTATCSV